MRADQAPSIGMIAPEMNEARSDAGKAATCACSAGSAPRSNAIAFAMKTRAFTSSILVPVLATITTLSRSKFADRMPLTMQASPNPSFPCKAGHGLGLYDVDGFEHSRHALPGQNQ